MQIIGWSSFLIFWLIETPLIRFNLNANRYDKRFVSSIFTGYCFVLFTGLFFWSILFFQTEYVK